MLPEIREKILQIVKQHRAEVKELKSMEGQVKYLLTQTKLNGYIVGYLYEAILEIIGEKNKQAAESIARDTVQGFFGEHLTIMTSLLLLDEIPPDKIPDEIKRIFS